MTTVIHRPPAARRRPPGLQGRGDGDQVDHYDRHQYYGGHAPRHSVSG
jgi:hypothetical protein